MPEVGPIVVAGEALADLVPNGGGFTTHLGGGPFTAARTLARLGRQVWFAGALSTDGLGTQLRTALVADGVRLDCVTLVDAPTTLAVADVDAEGAARYRFYTDGTSAPALSAVTLPAGVTALHVGTLGLVLEPMATVIETLVIEAPLDVLVMVDPNCRPDLVTDRRAYRARLDRVLARADLLKVSVEDLAWLEPDARPAEAARRLGGPAVVTAGGEGAIVVTREDTVWVPAYPVRVVDTIGAGDAFGGGLLAWWMERGLGKAALNETAALVSAAVFAARVASVVVGRAGADPPQRIEVL
jgi:fructokinase